MDPFNIVLTNRDISGSSWTCQRLSELVPELRAAYYAAKLFDMLGAP